MNSSLLANFVVSALLFTILSSLGFALFYLLFTPDTGRRTLNALSLRIGLSMALFIGLLLAIHFGWVTPAPPAL